ncbi:hypothetical protein Sste5346_009174 [Sporothrix stenoceras]|uniref:RNase H type-1 domain-containing protein n=1 Tax=Sporothrix stenoceras TaxID=5173 RepID=A0ABR3YLS3_9PEZI
MSQCAGRGPDRGGHNNNAGPGGSNNKHTSSSSPTMKSSYNHNGGHNSNGGTWNVWTNKRNSGGTVTNATNNSNNSHNNLKHGTRVNSAGSPSSVTYQIPNVVSPSTHSPHSSPPRPFLPLPPSVQAPVPTSMPPLPHGPHGPPAMHGPSPPDYRQGSHNMNHGYSHAHIPHGSPPIGADYARGFNGTKYTRRGHLNNNQFYTNGGSNGNNGGPVRGGGSNDGNRIGSNHSSHSNHSGGGSHGRQNSHGSQATSNNNGQSLDIVKIKNDAFKAGRLHGYQDGYREAQRVFYNEGHRDGHREGHGEGHKEGHKEGLREGQKEGHRLGYKEGHRAGHRDGHQEGRQAGHREGHQEGHQAGYHEGYYQGHYTSHQDGYDQGHGDGYEEGFRWASTFWTPAPLKPDAPEFVPGGAGGQYSSPVVVDGSSGRSVDHVKFRKWLNDVEYRKLARPVRADMAKNGVVALSIDSPVDQESTQGTVIHHDEAVDYHHTEHPSDNQVENAVDGHQANESVDNYAVQNVDQAVDQYDGQLVDIEAYEPVAPRVEVSVEHHVGHPTHAGDIQPAQAHVEDHADHISEQLIDLDSPKAVEEKTAVYAVSVGAVDKADEANDSSDDLLVTPHEDQVVVCGSFDTAFYAKIDKQLDDFCQTLGEQMMNDFNCILDQHDQGREERLQQFAELSDKLMARADDMGVEITKELEEAHPEEEAPEDAPELMVDTTSIDSPVRSPIIYPSPASTPSHPQMPFMPRVARPAGPQIVSLSRPVSPQSPKCPKLPESVATVIHDYPTEKENFPKMITFGDVPVIITEKIKCHIVKPAPAPTPTPVAIVEATPPPIVETTPLAVVEASPPAIIEDNPTLINKNVEAEEDCASDTATVDDHSTAAFELLDDDTSEPVEPTEATRDVIYPFPPPAPKAVAPKVTGFVQYKKKKGKGKKKAKKAAQVKAAQAKASSSPVVVEDKAEVVVFTPPVEPRPTMKFEDISIFSSDGPEPILGHYHSKLYQAQPIFEIGPDQAPQITESYPTFRNRPRHSRTSAYSFNAHQLLDPIVEIHDKDGVVFPVGGRTPPRGIVRQVPDHVVYKFGIPPANFVAYNDPSDSSGDEKGNRPPVGTELLARCVQHGLSTCPMCAITPSFRFLGPGESVSRTLEYNGKPAGDSQTSPAIFWRFRPAGFSDFEVHGHQLVESSFAAAQHPDEANPFCHMRMMPQYDAEVLGHHVQGEHAKEKPVPPSDLDTYCCDQCGGLTWLVTRRSRPNGGGPNGGNNSSSTTTGDRTFGKQHPSHHATFNEAWARSRSFCRTMVDGGRGENRFPEQAGTTRSLFVEIASVLAVTKKGTNDSNGGHARFGLAAYFGPNSRHNSRLDLDMATASMETARDAVASDGNNRTRLVDLPFEQFTINAGPIAAVAVALHRLWTDVVPMHRSAIDRVTRYNSDHSRRKAYRFRAIIMTDSQYVVDLFSDNIHKRWKRKFKPYEDTVMTDAIGEGKDEGNTGEAISTKTKTKKKSKPKKRKTKKQKEEVAKKRADEEEAEQALLAATDGGKAIRVTTTVVTDEYTEYEIEPAATNSNNSNNPNKRKASMLDDLIDLDLATRGRHRNRAFSVSTTTPTSSRSNSRSRSHSPPMKRLTPVVQQSDDVTSGGLFAPLLGPPTRDELDFDRPDGRFVYASQRGGPPLSNGILVQLVRRYIELLRWHGVKVAFYEVDSKYVQGARSLAEEVVE